MNLTLGFHPNIAHTHFASNCFLFALVVKQNELRHNSIHDKRTIRSLDSNNTKCMCHDTKKKHRYELDTLCTHASSVSYICITQKVYVLFETNSQRCKYYTFLDLIIHELRYTHKATLLTHLHTLQFRREIPTNTPNKRRSTVRDKKISVLFER